MIQGLRALPWLEEARGEPGQSDCLDCDVCMKSNEYEMRRRMMCGFIAEAERIDGSRFIPDGMSRDDVSICPGYTTTLPEVFDARRTFHHYDTGQLVQSCGGRVPPALWDALASLKGEIGSKESYRMREKSDEMKRNGGSHGPR